MRKIFLTFTHALMLAIGFALGIYMLPILTAPKGPDDATLMASSQGALFSAEFTRELKGSDFLHWGEGSVSLTQSQIVHMGSLAAGPDYMVYLVSDFVQDEAEFNAIKLTAQLIGPVKTFDGFILDIPEGIDIEAYTTVVVWCEAFGEFITAAQYREPT